MKACPVCRRTEQAIGGGVEKAEGKPRGVASFDSLDEASGRKDGEDRT